MNEALLQELLDAGTPAMLVVKVAAEMTRLATEAEALERRRRADRERQKAKRDNGNNVMSRDIDDVADVTDTPPVLDKETSPKPPKEINPTPRVGNALPRKAAGFSAPEGVSPENWSTFCQQRKKPLTRIAFNRICGTLAEGAEAGWPPGELIERSIERGYETVFIPKEKRNGQHRPSNDRDEIRNPILRASLEREAERRGGVGGLSF